MSTPIIRLATAADNTVLAQLGAETFRDTFADYNTPEDMASYLATWFTPEQIGRDLADPELLFLIAEIDGEPAGYAKLHAGVTASGVTGRRPIELARLYSRTQWIGQGVGAALMLGCLAEAHARDHDVIWLGVWERNTRAQAFYRKWGFEVAGTISFQLGSDLQNDFVMQRPVLMVR